MAAFSSSSRRRGESTATPVARSDGGSLPRLNLLDDDRLFGQGFRRLRNGPKVGLHRLPAAGEFLTRLLVRDGWSDDHLLALLPVHRSCDWMPGRQLAAVEKPEHLVEVAPAAHWRDE